MRVTLPPWHRARHTAAPADEVQDCFNKPSFYSEDLSIKRSEGSFAQHMPTPACLQLQLAGNYF
jgi:hypothetical protein